MSKIKLTLTAEHYKLISSQIIEVTKFHEEFGETIIVPLTLEFELPNPWRTDIWNAPKDESEILIKTCGGIWLVYWSNYGWCDGYESFNDSEIAYWMEIPKVPGV